MNSKKFIEAAKVQGLTASELIISKSSSFSFSLFHGELDSYSVSTSSSILARGIYKGKMGSYATEKDDATTIDTIIENLKSNALISEKEEKPVIFEGSKKYHKKNVYNPLLDEWKAEDKIALLHKVEDTIKAKDKRISEVQCEYSESSSEETFANSYGLNLKDKSNYYVIVASVVAKDGEETKSSYKVFLSSDPKAFNLDDFATKVVEDATSLLHGTPIKNKKYKAVLSKGTVASFLSAILSSCSAEEVQKHSSLLEGKIGEQVLSKKLTIEEKPLTKNCFFSYFDDEGVARTNKKVFDKGVLKTYFHNLETAAKAGVESTGNASRRGGRIGISFQNIVVKPGKLSEEELFEKIGNGVYITSISGLHAGLNPQSGDFSLQAEGFHVENGKKVGALTLITVAGNLFKIFNDVIAVGNNNELLVSGMDTPSIAVKNLAVNS